jgi:hypothetical protein
MLKKEYSQTPFVNCKTVIVGPRDHMKTTNPHLVIILFEYLTFWEYRDSCEHTGGKGSLFPCRP